MASTNWPFFAPFFGRPPAQRGAPQTRRERVSMGSGVIVEASGVVVTNQHVIVGGRFYDVLDGRYRIEPAGEGKVILHLSSRHRLNTHLGRYASWWSERIMDEIQGNILGVIRQRAEAQSRSFQ